MSHQSLMRMTKKMSQRAKAVQVASDVAFGKRLRLLTLQARLWL
jgi:hypothetical protein